MARFEQMRDRLPTLYRPEEDDDGLLSLMLRAVAEELEELNREASDALQAHWFGYADSALYSPFFIRSRQLAGLPFPAYGDPVLDEFPYVHDLARLASLLALPPWREPPALAGDRRGVPQEDRTDRRAVPQRPGNPGRVAAHDRSPTAGGPGGSAGGTGPAFLARRVRATGEALAADHDSGRAARHGRPPNALDPGERRPRRGRADPIHPGCGTRRRQRSPPPQTPSSSSTTVRRTAPAGIAYQDTLAPGDTLRLRPGVRLLDRQGRRSQERQIEAHRYRSRRPYRPWPLAARRGSAGDRRGRPTPVARPDALGGHEREHRGRAVALRRSRVGGGPGRPPHAALSLRRQQGPSRWNG